MEEIETLFRRKIWYHFIKLRVSDHFLMHFPRVIAKGACNAKLFNLCKLMDSKYTQSISTMRASFCAEAIWISSISENKKPSDHFSMLQPYGMGNRDGSIDSFIWYSQSGCSAVAMRYLLSPSPVTCRKPTKLLSCSN